MNEGPRITSDAKIGAPSFTTANVGFARARRDRRARPVVRGQDGTQWKDVYHLILTTSWSVFFLGLACVYVGINTLFAGLYLLSPNGILHEHPNSFLDAFFFSVQTFGSIGYGVLAPNSTYVNFVVTGESFVSLMYAAIDTLYDQEMEIIVLLSGTDETLAQVIYARQAYTADDILFGRRFVDVLQIGASGRMEVDLRRFHDTVDLSPPESQALS